MLTSVGSRGPTRWQWQVGQRYRSGEKRSCRNCCGLRVNSDPEDRFVFFLSIASDINNAKHHHPKWAPRCKSDGKTDLTRKRHESQKMLNLTRTQNPSSPSTRAFPNRSLRSSSPSPYTVVVLGMLLVYPCEGRS